MLNEMNPKLKALLAAGLIGTAGLGMQSCSNPSDSVYYPYTVEAPSTDNPGSGGGTENLGNGGGEENGGGGETMEEVTFSDLGVTDENDQERLRHVRFQRNTGFNIVNGVINHVYMGKNKGFEPMSKADIEISGVPAIYNDGDLYCASNDNKHIYHIPANMKDDFIAAGVKL